jgi:transcriptional regulator of heat shock response
MAKKTESEKQEALKVRRAAADVKKRNKAAEERAVKNFVNMSSVINNVSLSFIKMAVDDLKKIELTESSKKQVKAAVVIAEERANKRNVDLPDEWEYVKTL